MDISTTEWIVTVALTVGVLIFDIVLITRRPHEPSIMCGWRILL